MQSRKQNFITSAIYQNVFLITWILCIRLLEKFCCMYSALTHFSGWQWFNLCLWHFRSTIYLDSKLYAYTHSQKIGTMKIEMMVWLSHSFQMTLGRREKIHFCHQIFLNTFFASCSIWYDAQEIAPILSQFLSWRIYSWCSSIIYFLCIM